MASFSDDDTMCNETGDTERDENDLLNLSLTTTEEEEATASATP